MFNIIKFRLGVHATIPLYMDVVKARSIGNLEHINMVIDAKRLTPVQLAIATLCDEIGLIIRAQNSVDTELTKSLGEFRNNLVLSANNNLVYQLRVSEKVVEQVGLLLNTYRVDPDLVMSVAKDAVLSNGLEISADDNVAVHPTIKIEEVDNDMTISVGNGVEIANIRKTLGELDNILELNVSKRIAKIQKLG